MMEAKEYKSSGVQSKFFVCGVCVLWTLNGAIINLDV